MKVKELLKALCKAGMLEGYLYFGNVILDSNPQILEGKVYPKKEYFYSFKQVGLVVHSSKIKTTQGSIVYLYSI